MYLLLMEDPFDLGQLTGEARVLSDHAAAQSQLREKISWLATKNYCELNLQLSLYQTRGK